MPKAQIIAEKGKQEVVVTRIFDSPREIPGNHSVPVGGGPRSCHSKGNV